MSKVSFTIRRPNQLDGSRSSTGSPAPKRAYSDREPERDDRDEDDSDAESAVDDELVTGFDRFGVQRCASQRIFRHTKKSYYLHHSVHEKKPPKGPLTIPAQADRDWRAIARKRRGHVPAYVPPSAAAQTGADGSVGGLGTRDAINSGPQLSGIQMRKKIKLEEDPDARSSRSRSQSPAQPEKMDVEQNGVEMKEEEDEDARALRALLDPSSAGPSTALAAIPVRMTEAEAYKQDVETFPESATLDDYARVPIEQFGAALLRGMGWDPNAAKSGSSAPHKNAKGERMEGSKRKHVEPYIPAARPALLGIGAKEAEVLDDGSDPKKRKGGGRPEKRYVPLVKVGTGASGEASTSEQRVSVRGDRDRERGGGSGSGSGDGRRNRDEKRTRDDRDKARSRDDRDRERDRDRDRYRDKGRDERRDRDRDYRDRDDRPRDRDRDRDRDRPRESDRDKDRDRASSRRR